jgi:hypothetical protein
MLGGWPGIPPVARHLGHGGEHLPGAAVPESAVEVLDFRRRKCMPGIFGWRLAIYQVSAG